MVTAIKTAERTSIHAKSAANGSTKLDEKEMARIQGEHAKSAATAVDAAIKARNESFASLATGAAYAVWFFAKYGRTDYINRLFVGLVNGPSRSDADNLRSMYIPKLIALYGTGGQRDPEDETKWLKRNTAFVTFSAEGEKDGNYFRPTGFKDDDTRSQHVKHARDAIAAETVETLAAVSWKDKIAITANETAYDRDRWLMDIKRVLIKGAKQTGDAESNITIATIEGVMRDLGMSKSMKGEVRDAFAAEPPVSKAKSETGGEKTEIPAEHASQKAQAAA